MEQVYEISKDVPIPQPMRRHNYPYKELQVGESFYVEGVRMQILCNANLRQSKLLDRKFVCRKEGEGIRVWRVA